MCKLFLLLFLLLPSLAQAKIIIKPDPNIDTNILIEKALDNGEKEIYLSKGIHYFSKILKTSVNDLTISGEGLIKVKENIPLLFDLSGDNLNITLNVDGENKLGSVIRAKGNNINIYNSNIRNLSVEKNSSIAISIDTNGYFNVKNNSIGNLYSAPDFKNGNGVGMSRAIAIIRRGPIDKPVLSNISNNNIYNVFGEEGDAITLWSKGASKYSSANVNVLNNIINNYSRRAIKIQGEDVLVSGNTIKNVYNDGQNYNCSSAISVYVAKNIKITNNNINDSICSSINVFMLKNNANINDVGNVIIDNNKVVGDKLSFKVGDLKAPSSMLKTGKILFMPKNENAD